jgi:uncharacterized integral membrane protein (TIGR00698 family)
MKIPIRNTIIQKIIFISFGLFCLSPFSSSPISLASGFIVAVICGNPYQGYLHKYIHLLLKISIVGLGFGLELHEALQAGKTGFAITVISISTVLVAGHFLGRILKLEKPLAYLITAGTAICGGSAIAAVSPIVKPDNKHISLALAIIFTLNSIALFAFPMIGHWLHLSQEQFGLWAAVGIHDTSSVVGAANKYGNEALKIATTVKLARALWIIPLSILTIFIFKNKGSKVKIPWFIGYFIIAILLNTYLPPVDEISPYITASAKAGLNLTLFLIGTTLSINTLKTIGIKPLLFAIVLWLLISTGCLLYIMH